MKFGVLILAVLPLSCATMLHPPDSSFTLSSTNSIIFGKDEVICDGQPVEYKGTIMLVEKSIVHHISPYVSDEAINKNRLVAGRYAFRVTDEEGGYFDYAVPPGKYYFVELDYIGVLPLFDQGAVGIRTYMPIHGRVAHPYLLTFDVPPGRAVYIGTIRHEFEVLRDNWFGFKAEYTISFTNEFDAAREWFLKSHASLKDDVVVGTNETRMISVAYPGMTSWATNQIATNSPFYKYDSALVESIEKRWYAILDTKDFKPNKTGKVVVRFHLHSDGTVSDVQILENQAVGLLDQACELAIKGCSPFSPWPPDMVKKVGKDYRQINFTFYYY